MPTLFFWVCACSVILAQEDHYTVVAQPGDGIFSLLRKQGLDPVKHYEEFIKLNSEKIKNGSLLQVGVGYEVPRAEDSFKKTGVVVQSKDGVEQPIFDSELGQMSLKSETLKNAVYYLIVENEESAEDYARAITENLAAELMVHGAQVYILGQETADSLGSDKPLTQMEKMGNYIEAINKRYIQNSGKYQRVLVIRATGVNAGNQMDVAVYHYNKSELGQRFANNIQNVFKENSISNRTYKNVDMIFDDKGSLYLARNILPAISLITLENTSKKSEEKIAVRLDRKRFANLLTNGIMNDYVDLEIEE
jgi:N-acetylmuramoyl-L-alanine amidase